MTEPTKEEVIAFWAHLSKTFGSTVVSKADSTFMSLLGSTLDLFGVQDKENFLKNYATTIGKTIYLPFEPGTQSPDGNWTLWSQARVCIHEHQHVIQYRNEGVSFSASYLSSSANRARYETEAYRCNMEVDLWHYGALADPAGLAGKLTAYSCDADDIAVATKVLKLSSEAIKRGAITNESTKIGLDWLNTNTPHLKFSGGA